MFLLTNKQGEVALPVAPQPTPSRAKAGAHSQPKTIKERMQWMADNLPDFSEEMVQANAIKRQALAERR